MPVVPVGCNLLSTQLHALLQELAALEESHNENSILGGSSVWCPQPPPRAALSASYRSARLFLKPQRAKESTSQDLTTDESAKITRDESAEYGIFTDLEEAGMKSSTSSLETQILRLLEGYDSENANSEQHQFSNDLNEIGGDFRSDYDPDFISDDDELTLLRAYQTSDSCSEHEITSITSSGENSENSLSPPSAGEKQFSTGHDEGTEWELGCNASDGSEEVDATGIDAVHSLDPSDNSDTGSKDEVGLQDRVTHSTSAKACEVEGDLNTCDSEENIVLLEAMEDPTITAPTSESLNTSNSRTISNHPSSELRVVDEPSSSVEGDPISDVPISLNEDATQQVIPDSSSILLSASCDDTATVIEDNVTKRLGAEEEHKLKDSSALASRYAEPTQAEFFEPGTVGSNEASNIILTNQFFESAGVELVDVITHGDASTPADVCVDANNIVVASTVPISVDSPGPVFFNGGVMSSVNGEAEPDDLSGDSKLQPRNFLESLESEMSATAIDFPLPLPPTLTSDTISGNRSTPTSDEERAVDAILQTFGSSSRLDTEDAAVATEADDNEQVCLQVSEYEVDFEDGEDQEDQELYKFEDE
uniref:Uncharacterized protein n=1 Tax=Globisporangium ultimum (strain ATCC 200006 / CBS 805.95 / DAOM BR144) TaxID=431595 RepID=K3WMU1_GLOUD